MNVVLWVAGLRILAALLVVSVVWPGLLEPWRGARCASAHANTRRNTR
jgi:hypothetical protein